MVAFCAGVSGWCACLINRGTTLLTEELANTFSEIDVADILSKGIAPILLKPMTKLNFSQFSQRGEVKTH